MRSLAASREPEQLYIDVIFLKRATQSGRANPDFIFAPGHDLANQLFGVSLEIEVSAFAGINFD